VLTGDGVRQLVTDLVGDDDPAFAVEDLAGDDYEIAAVVEAAQTPPFFGKRRVVVARSIGRFSAQDVAPLIAYLADPLPTTAVVLVRPRLCPTRARLVFPYAGRSAILDGHDALSHHRLWNFAHPKLKAFGVVDNTQRYALDIVAVDDQGAMFRGDGKRNRDWFSWGHPVRAPAEGRVIATHDGQPDNDVVGDENRWTDRDFTKDEASSDGNYVLIDHGEGEMSLLAHLREGSVKVHKGDLVHAGDVVAEAGNSGSSLGPHTHYELRDGWGLKGVHARPAYFRDVRIAGTGEVAGPGGLLIDTGDVIVAR